MKQHSYELRVKIVSDELQLSLLQMPPRDTRGDGKPKMVSFVDAKAFALVQSAVAKALKNNGYSFSDVKRSRKAPFKLEEEDGIRLDLVFRGTKGISKRSRVEDIVLGIQSMGREEAYYWHAKTTRGEDGDNWNGLKAMRILLAGE